MQRIECPNCRHKLKYGDEHAGKKAKCQQCSHSFRLPVAVGEPGTPATPAEPVKSPEPPDSSRPAGLEPAEVKRYRGRSGVKYTEAKSTLSVMPGHFRSDTLSCDYLISPDGWRVFHSGGAIGFWGSVATSLEHLAVRMLDGKPFSPGHDYDPATFVFSTDSRHFAYVAKDKRGAFVVLDGVEASERFETVRNIALCQEGRGVAFVAHVGRQRHVVHNGRVGTAFDTIHAKSLGISRDGQTVYYSGVRGKQAYVVLGAEERQVSEQVADAASPDGSLRAWIEKADRGACVTVDGRSGASFDEVAAGSLRFSPNGARIAYAARRGTRWHAVLDEDVGPGYAAIDPQSLAFSPDGGRFAYAACAERSWWTGRGDWRPVIDGVEQAAYTEVGPVRFSPDGTRVGYAATDGQGTHLVLDGKPEGCWGGVSDLTFGPDGRYACVTADARSGKRSLLIDGREGPRYAKLELHGFSPDGSRVVAMAFGVRHAEPTPGWPDARDEGGFLVIDDDYESRCWISTRQKEAPDPNLFQAVRVGFSGPRSVYVVSLFINPRQVYFDRLDVACP